MEKVLKEDLGDGREVSVAWEIAEHLCEDETVRITTEDVIDAIIEVGGSAMDKMRIMDALSAMRETFSYIRRDMGKNYYRRPWGYQAKNIPPKVAVCSSRHKGRKCKKKRK